MVRADAIQDVARDAIEVYVYDPQEGARTLEVVAQNHSKNDKNENHSKKDKMKTTAKKIKMKTTVKMIK